MVGLDQVGSSPLPVQFVEDWTVVVPLYIVFWSLTMHRAMMQCTCTCVVNVFVPNSLVFLVRALLRCCVNCLLDNVLVYIYILWDVLSVIVHVRLCHTT